MGIDNSGSQFKSVEHKPFSEKIGDKIRSIFIHRDHQSPQETLHSLASLGVAPKESLFPSSDVPIVPDKSETIGAGFQPDQSEIDKLTKSIKELIPQSQPKSETVTEIPKPT